MRLNRSCLVIASGSISKLMCDEKEKKLKLLLTLSHPSEWVTTKRTLAVTRNFSALPRKCEMSYAAYVMQNVRAH